VNTGDGVSGHRIGEGRITALKVIVLAILFRVRVWVGEAHVDETRSVPAIQE